VNGGSITVDPPPVDGCSGGVLSFSSIVCRPPSPPTDPSIKHISDYQCNKDQQAADGEQGRRKKSSTDQGRRDSGAKQAAVSPRESRPDNLRLPGGSSGNMSRRRSSTGIPEALRVGSTTLQAACPSPGSLRRNSYAGIVPSGTGSQKMLSPPTGTFYSGRRNSAITYLTDGAAGSPGSGSGIVGGGRRGSLLSSSGLINRRPSGEDIRPGVSNLARTSSGSVHGQRGLGGSVASGGSPSQGQISPDDCVESPCSCPLYTVLVLGSVGVGKTTLTQQLLTSEYLANADNYPGTHLFLYLITTQPTINTNNYLEIR